MGNLGTSSLHVLFLAIASAVPVWAVTQGDSSAAQPASCFAYFGEICFPTFEVTSQTMTYPVDFAIDEINLAGGAHVTLYEGVGLAEQDDVTGLTKAVEFDNSVAYVEVMTGRSKHGAYFDVHYKPKGNHWGVLQVFGYVKTKAEGESISRFIGQFHQCVHNGTSLNCSGDWPLRSAAKFLAGVMPEGESKAAK